MKISARGAQSSSKVNHPSAKAKGGGKKGGSGDGFDAGKARGDMSEQELLKQQQKLQDHARLMTLKSNLIAIEHDMKKSIIANIRY